MKYAKLFAGIVLMASAAAASAANINRTINLTLEDGTGFSGDSFTRAGAPVLNKTFLDTFNFTVSQPSFLSSSLTSISTTSTYDLNITSLNLYSGSTLLAAGVRDATGVVDVWHLTTSSAGLGAGNYSLQVGGKILGGNGGSFALVANTSPVPEPETWSMVGVSLAALGFMARRKAGRKAA